MDPSICRRVPSTCCRALAALLLLLLLQSVRWGQVSGRELTWEKINGAMKVVSAGLCGVWGVDKDNQTFIREGTYGRPHSEGLTWTQVEDEFAQLVQVDAGRDVVWGVDQDDYIFYRHGITACNPAGEGWVHVQGKLTHVSVSENGHVWGVNAQEHIYVRLGTGTCTPGPYSWKQIDGYLVQISVGYSGVWGVNKHDTVYYRLGTYGDTGAEGSDWKSVDGKMKSVSSGQNVLLAVDGQNQVHIRNGVNASNPTGHSWTKLNGAFSGVSAYSERVLWAVNNDGDVYITH